MKKLKQNRVASFISVTLVYIVAALVGIIVYKALNYAWWLNLLIADTAATGITFVFSVVFNNASVYDPYWSVQPIFIIAAYASGKEINPVRLLFIIAVCFWGVRLTANWAYTFKNLLHQDWRYTMLDEKTGGFYPIINFVGIHMVPTLIVYGCVLPAVYVFINDCEINILSVIFIALSLGAAALQGVSDIQMHKYRKNRNSPFIRVGLWRYSRHPNYLGEILMWWGIALAAVSLFPGAWYLACGAFANTLLFLFVSIPMADKRQSAKLGFDEYKAETRRLVPIKKKIKKTDIKY